MNNYYNGQIKDYITNFENASNEIGRIYNLLNNLYSSFSTASGVDIDKVRNDIEAVANELDLLKTKIDNAKKKTKGRADSCDRCYNKYANASYPAYETKDRKYWSGANVDIGSDGLISITRWYTKKRSFIESLFMSSAGEFSDVKKIGTSEMFNS